MYLQARIFKRVSGSDSLYQYKAERCQKAQIQPGADKIFLRSVLL